MIYSVLAPSIIRGMGVTEASGMWHSAVSYLFVRALGTPAATLWLVTNGIFRGKFCLFIELPSKHVSLMFSNLGKYPCFLISFYNPLGLGDTKTPLKYSLFFTALNAILDPFFIFNLKFGASGAAAGTALAQYIALIPLLLSLNRKVKIDVLGQLSELKTSLKQYLRSGSLVLARTFGKVLAYSVCARQAVSILV